MSFRFSTTRQRNNSADCHHKALCARAHSPALFTVASVKGRGCVFLRDSTTQLRTRKVGSSDAKADLNLGFSVIGLLRSPQDSLDGGQKNVRHGVQNCQIAIIVAVTKLRDRLRPMYASVHPSQHRLAILATLASQSQNHS